MPELNIVSKVDMVGLVEELVFQASREDIMEFILRLDERMAEVEFTQQLINNLNDSLDEEDKGDDHKLLEIRKRFNNLLAIVGGLDRVINE